MGNKLPEGATVKTLAEAIMSGIQTDMVDCDA